jgi:hypothetical protein
MAHEQSNAHRTTFILGSAVGVFVGNLFFHGIMGDWVKGLMIAVTATAIYIPAMYYFCK